MSKTNEWYTPSNIIELAREVMGEIDLDPASCDEANLTVKATRYHTSQDNGLRHPWKGRIWLNAPFSFGMMPLFINKLLLEVDIGNVEEACVLFPFTGFARWHYRLFDACSAICICGDPKFGGTAKSNKYIIACGYIGRNTDRFWEAFSELGNTFCK